MRIIRIGVVVEDEDCELVVAVVVTSIYHVVVGENEYWIFHSVHSNRRDTAEYFAGCSFLASTG